MDLEVMRRGVASIHPPFRWTIPLLRTIPQGLAGIDLRNLTPTGGVLRG